MRLSAVMADSALLWFRLSEERGEGDAVSAWDVALSLSGRWPESAAVSLGIAVLPRTRTA